MALNPVDANILKEINSKPDALVIMTANWCGNCVALKNEKQSNGETKIQSLDTITAANGVSMYMVDAQEKAALCQRLAPTYNGIPHFQRLKHGRPTASCAGNSSIEILAGKLGLSIPGPVYGASMHGVTAANLARWG